MRLNMYELAYWFWRAAEEQPFTPSEMSLYFLLLNRANMSRWEMPFRCPTTAVCMLMGTSKQNVLRARAELIERGLITYTRSNTRGRCGQYELLPFGQSQLPNGLPNGMPVQVSDGLPSELPAYNIIDKEHKSSITNVCEEIKSVDELESDFSSDEPWLSQVVSLASSPCIQSCDDVRAFIHQFFDTLRVKKVKEREEKECREHFINWLMKISTNQAKSNNNDKLKSGRKDRPGSDDESSRCTSAYYEPF